MRDPKLNFTTTCPVTPFSIDERERVEPMCRNVLLKSRHISTMEINK